MVRRPSLLVSLFALALLVLVAGVNAARPEATHADGFYRTRNLRAGAVTTTSITIRWDAEEDFVVTGHGVRTNATPDGAWMGRTLTAAEVEARTLTFTGLQPSRTYTVELYDFFIPYVCALGAPCPRITSLEVSTKSPPVPAAPSNLRRCGVGELCFADRVTLSWNDNSSNEDRFEFEWSRAQTGTPPDSGPWTRVRVAANRQSAAVLNSSFVSGGLYYFRVRACNGVSCSTYSNRVDYTAP